MTNGGHMKILILILLVACNSETETVSSASNSPTESACLNTKQLLSKWENVDTGAEMSLTNAPYDQWYTVKGFGLLGCDTARGDFQLKLNSSYIDHRTCEGALDTWEYLIECNELRITWGNSGDVDYWK